MSIKLVTIAGGCFWGMEEIIRTLPGVVETTVGYAGGTTENPTYKEVSQGTTGHAESIQMKVETAQFDFRDFLTNWFFKMHNPTTPNQQGNDRGSQYRSVIFYHDGEQRQTAEEVIAQINAEKFWKKPIVTEVREYRGFTPAEDYHQDYLRKNPGGYTCHFMRTAPET
ncbi:MAG: peptide-methionine (S)-S-oxide reductase MsrA [Bdellovibrionaceae bacterium]|nr:peptide-methionine (S)-S-oxide reductase MsrA [Pseudobdellovibrionaceae bacterium]